MTLPVKGGTLEVRPIGPDDAAALRAMIERADPADVRFRFHGAVQVVPSAWIDRLTHIDYDCEMALIGLEGAEILSVARMALDPGGESAEFALAVRTDQQRRGIGRGMMGLLLDYARSRGVSRVWGTVEVDNTKMLALARGLGMAPVGSAARGEVRVAIDL